LAVQEAVRVDQAVRWDQSQSQSQSLWTQSQSLGAKMQSLIRLGEALAVAQSQQHQSPTGLPIELALRCFVQSVSPALLYGDHSLHHKLLGSP
jgi:hypothetical protein